MQFIEYSPERGKKMGHTGAEGMHVYPLFTALLTWLTAQRKEYETRCHQLRKRSKFKL